MNSEFDHLALVGPTASGKSALALAFARANPGVEIISADSMQVYRDMDIGTAKPTPAERTEVIHHLIDVADPCDDYSVARFQRDVAGVVAEIEQRGSRAVLVGGTGLYVQAVIDDLEIPGQFPAVRAQLESEADSGVLHARLEELDPVAAARMNPTNRRRVVRALEVTLGSGRPFSSFGPGMDAYPPSKWRMVGLDRPRAVLDRRIEQRYREQMDAGFLDEVRSLLERPGGISRGARQALGYKELADHLEGRCTLDQALELANARTRKFARRQQRWFRRDPRVRWIEPDGEVGVDRSDGDDMSATVGRLEAMLADWGRVAD